VVYWLKAPIRLLTQVSEHTVSILFRRSLRIIFFGDKLGSVLWEENVCLPTQLALQGRGDQPPLLQIRMILWHDDRGPESWNSSRRPLLDNIQQTRLRRLKRPTNISMDTSRCRSLARRESRCTGNPVPGVIIRPPSFWGTSIREPGPPGWGSFRWDRKVWLRVLCDSDH
jgi:hypothetical protein